MSQSSNDTFPTAMHIALLMNMKGVIDSLRTLITALEKKVRNLERL